ncbi:DgyrCDS4378 [Dimorphilus gyrociliatus]|uniref:DgyrCDS4378 n=1 Tax=Dimorphilus gyrociliatus TaxID=2664684 RepID=A0A7I8VHD9_9ANNE|nr:DgyrCDS4378 [Dimorphilus gyrociliatus]
MLSKRKTRKKNSLQNASSDNSSKNQSIVPVNDKRRLTRTTFLSTNGTSTFPFSLGIQKRFENNYRMSPVENDTFNSTGVRKVIREVLENNLKGAMYERQAGERLRRLTGTLKDNLKEVIGSRYKIICWVVLGQDASQGLIAGSRCLWYKETDHFVSESFKVNNIFAVAVVYGIYCE